MYELPDGCTYYPHQNKMSQEEIERLENMSIEYGLAYDSYLVNEPNREYLWSDNHNGVVGFATRGRYINVVGGMIASQDNKSRLISNLFEFATRNNLTVSCFNIGEEDAFLFHSHGFQVTKLGEDYVVDLANCTWAGKKFLRFRYYSNFVSKAGIVMKEIRPNEMAPAAWNALVTELLSVENDCLAVKPQSRPTAVFQGQLTADNLGSRRLFVAFADGGKGRAEGFVVCNPYKGRETWSVEIYRHRVDCLRGVLIFVIHQMMIKMKEEGVQTVSLGIIPGINCEEPMPGDSALCRKANVFFATKLNYIVDTRGIHAFKSRFRPRTENSFVCVSPKASVGSILAFFHIWGAFKIRPMAVLRRVWEIFAKRHQRVSLIVGKLA